MEQATERARRSTRIGIVTSDKADKTVVVSVVRTMQHPRYKKYIRRTKRYMAHDETNRCKIGDQVEIIESRPLSARKRWRVIRVLGSEN